MNILLVAASETEKNFLSDLSNTFPSLDIQLTGIGMVETTFTMTQLLAKKRRDLVINVGICGSFHESYCIGSVVRITTDIFSEPGAQSAEGFLSALQIELPVVTDTKEFFPFEESPLMKSFPKVKGITVNTVHGDKEGVEKIKARINPDVESMEGAAVFFVAGKFGVPVIQIRSISNFVEIRNKSNWNIPLALQNLKKELHKVVGEIYS